MTSFREKTSLLGAPVFCDETWNLLQVINGFPRGLSASFTEPVNLVPVLALAFTMSDDGLDNLSFRAVGEEYFGSLLLAPIILLIELEQ
jgi:hypothetical protein